MKLEGGVEMRETIRHLVDNHIPVLGHIGLLPQKAANRGGFRIQGKDDEGWKRVMEDAKAVVGAGALSQADSVWTSHASMSR